MVKRKSPKDRVAPPSKWPKFGRVNEGYKPLTNRDDPPSSHLPD